MGREIRRVPPNWQHPKKTRYDVMQRREVEGYQPLYDEPFGPAMREWIKGWEAWERGERPPYFDASTHGHMQYWEYDCGPPDPRYYRPDWPEGAATWWQAYETVSEGTPVTPPFATQAELVDYLVANGDEWDQKRGNGGWSREAAESFVGAGWAPSMVITGGKVVEPRDGLPR